MTPPNILRSQLNVEIPTSTMVSFRVCLILRDGITKCFGLNFWVEDMHLSSLIHLEDPPSSQVVSNWG
jgi:hypothetical protein